MKVDLERVGTQIRVTIASPDGQRDSRAVGNLDIAADWIESWARRDLIAPLLPLGLAAPASIAPLPLPVQSLAVARTEKAAPAPLQVRAKFRVAVALGAMVTGDLVPTWGPALAVATRVGRVEPGVLGALDFGTAGPGQPGTVWRGQLGFLATWPLSVGRLELRPGVAIGANLVQERGWVSETVELCSDVEACARLLDPAGKAVTAKPANGRGKAKGSDKDAATTDAPASIQEVRTTLQTAAWLSPYAAATLSAALPVRTRFAVTGSLAVGATPMAGLIGSEGQHGASPDPWQFRANVGVEWRWL